MIKEFNPLRFVLIMMIFFHHAWDFKGGGASAVAFFFVLSGFCMTLGYKDKINNGDFSYVSYIKKRFTRFYPLHWLTLLVVVLLTQGIEGEKLLLMNASLLQSWMPETNYYFSFNAVSWFLSTLMFSVLTFPIIINFLERLDNKNKLFFAGLLGVIYVIVALCIPSGSRHALLYINPVARVFDFILGIYCAYFYLNLKTNNRCVEWSDRHKILLDTIFVFSFALFFSIAVLVAESDYSTIAGIYWIPIVICILSLSLGVSSNTLLHKVMQNKNVALLTRCSFSIMLWHTIVIGNIFDILPPPYAL